ncbi:Arabinose metabolism transcriptional repressor [Poriferisphaera corsica]|uniref:Arabinose metabolism transcriptional repressor n=1 Tax=Poriferisphaera corsica TaxID=2528020 RepID=A0A517YPP2_9BACT|nr:substrate-binding domain-containing protein [Poriferisphaera corsica]QDU32193.1 Arabinose metabolism transcriptional repressor [Poriferisphaera corsica]
MDEVAGQVGSQVGRRPPLFTQVAEKLRQKIRDGVVVEGERLPTERDLASRMGVSAVTVQKAIKELQREGLVKGKRGSGRFVALRTERKTWTVAVLLYDSIHFANPVMSHRLSGIQSPLEAAGYHVHYIAMNRRRADEADASWLASIDLSRYDGVVVLAHQAETSQVHSLSQQLPVVWMDQHCAGDQLMGVRVDMIGGGLLAAEHLASLGHRRVALLNAGRHVAACQEQHEGMQLYARRHTGFEVCWLNVTHSRDHEQVRQALDQVFIGDERPTALVCGAHDFVPLVMNYFDCLGLAIPRDVSLVSWDDVLMPPTVRLPLTVVDIDSAHAGGIASEVLCKLIDQKPIAPEILESQVKPAGLIVRESTAVAPSR